MHDCQPPELKLVTDLTKFGASSRNQTNRLRLWNSRTNSRPAFSPGVMLYRIHWIAMAEENDRHRLCHIHTPRLLNEWTFLLHHADLLHQANQIVEEFLLYDLAVLPVGNSAELNFEALLGR